MPPEEQVNWRIESWFKDLPAAQVSQLKVFHTELIKFNGKINLISPRTEKMADLVHFADGIIASRIILEATTHSDIYDLGSGNGIPGLVLATLAPSRTIHLVDADMRKCEFMKHVASKAGLKNVNVLHKRLEDLEDDSVMCASTRGLAAISKCLVLARKCAGPGCQMFHLKSDAWSTEIASIPSQVFAFWSTQHLVDYKLPAGDAVYSIVLTTKK
ncbi:MAG: RsmG family class I SAM-dependent methyltransferase [Bdellovibrionota bacterium]